jgi:ribosomal protein S18 acetylase RimI-like enzyme
LFAEQIHAYLRLAAGNERERVGCFTATFTPGNDHPMRNYAIPDEGAVASEDDIAALVAKYRSRDLKPRLEYDSGAAPRLETALIDAGFVLEARIPIMVATPGEVIEVGTPDGVEVVMAKSASDHADAIRVAGLAYREPAPSPPPALVEARQNMVNAGGGVALARQYSDGSAIGSGLFPVPRGRISELAAVGVLEQHRRHGTAAALMYRLAVSAFEAGVELLWLTAENDPEAAAARSVGFHLAEEEMIHISLPC